MRYIDGFFCFVLILFALVQYNDPDAPLWIAIYGLGALWTGLAAFRPATLAGSRALQAGLGLCLAAAVAGSLYMWPTEIATWWDNEVVREGMGLIILTVALALAALTVWRRRTGEARPAAA